MHADQPEHDAPIRRTSRDRYRLQLPSRVSCKCQKVVGIYENKTLKHTTTTTSAAMSAANQKDERLRSEESAEEKRHSIVFVSKEKLKKLKSTFSSFSHRTPRPETAKETNKRKKASINSFHPSCMHQFNPIAPANKSISFLLLPLASSCVR